MRDISQTEILSLRFVQVFVKHYSFNIPTGIFLTLAFVSCLIIFSTSCNPRKRMADTDVFFKKYDIRLHDVPDAYAVSMDDLDELVRLKPNRNIAWNRFNLGIYNLVDTLKRKEGLLKKSKKLARRDSLRVLKGKDPKNKTPRTFGSWLSYTVGEPPVKFDSSKVIKTGQQMEVFMG